MTIKVIGTGFGRTGTSSLKRALEQLGFVKCYHMKEVFEHPEHIPHWAAAARGEPADWPAVFEGFQAVVDWPGSAVWRELGAAYPEAKFIHSERPEKAWFKSFCDTIRPAVLGRVDGPPGWAEMCEAMINRRVFGGRGDEDEVCLEAYRRNSEAVRAEIPADRLLIFEPGAGWAPLCAFLGAPIPDTPYPHENTTADFQAAIGQRPGGNRPADP